MVFFHFWDLIRVGLMGGPRWSLQAAFAKATCALAESNRRIMQCQESPTSRKRYVHGISLGCDVACLEKHKHIYRTYGFCT